MSLNLALLFFTPLTIAVIGELASFIIRRRR